MHEENIKSKVLELYKKMKLCRRFEEKAVELVNKDEIFFGGIVAGPRGSALRSRLPPMGRYFWSCYPSIHLTWPGFH